MLPTGSLGSPSSAVLGSSNAEEGGRLQTVIPGAPHAAGGACPFPVLPSTPRVTSVAQAPLLPPHISTLGTIAKAAWPRP